MDLGDGRVDPDDLERKTMLVTLPPLPPGDYWVYYLAASAEDGHDEAGSFTFGVGVVPPGRERHALAGPRRPWRTSAPSCPGGT